MSVDKTASNYLKNFMSIREQEAQQINAPMREPELIPHIAHMDVPNVILSRAENPRFFGGNLRSGRPVWVPTMEQARPVSADRVHLYEEKLQEELIPLWPYSA